MTTTKIVPKCRYCHEDLFRVKFLGQDRQFALIMPNDVRSGFSVNLYTCKKCGYTELFDENPELTFETNETTHPIFTANDINQPNEGVEGANSNEGDK